MVQFNRRVIGICKQKDKAGIILFNAEPRQAVKKVGMQYIENPVSKRTTVLLHQKAHSFLG